MGGGSHTKKSLEDVKANLATELANNARDLLKSAFKITDKTINLETLLNKIAVHRFNDFYKYEFNEDASKMNPPNNLGDLRVSAKLCSIVPPIGTQVTKYLQAGVFSKLDLPKWMEQTAINDLSNVANTIAGSDTAKQWKYTEYRRTYDARKEDEDNYICNSVLVYCHGSLVEDGNRAELAVIYYVGVYYKTTSETKATRDAIQTSAYAGAQKLAGEGDATGPPTTDAKLKETLDKYATGKFRSEFNFPYGADSPPPDSYRAKGISSAFVTQTSQLHYVPDTKTDDLANYIEHQAYSGIDIPFPSVKKAAIKDTISEYKDIMKNASTKSWNVTRLEKTYIPADPTNNPVRKVGLILSWYDHKTTDTQVSISVTYIYMITVFYECQNAEQELASELFKVLCNNLRRHITGDNTLKDTADPAALKDTLLKYSTQEFKKQFKFEYKAKESDPPNRKAGGKVNAYEELLSVKSYPVQQKEVEDWMNAEVFEKGDRTFPSFADGHIYDDIVKHMMYYGSTETVKDNNWWYPVGFTKKYYDTDTTKKRDLQQFAFYLYALGDMTLNKIGNTGEEGVHIRRLFIYYLGVFSNYDADSDGWGLS